MTGIRTLAVKFGLFALASALLLMLLVNTMRNGLPGDSREFDAQFTDVSGLRVGDDVKVAGVRVGQVTAIEVHDQGAQVSFKLQDSQRILDTTRVVMRYQNLLGQRYLSLVQQGEEGADLESGADIPVEMTDPGFDLTELLNGFRPLFEVLQPEDVNTLAESLVKVLQGESGTVEQLLAQTAELTNFFASRDDVYGEVLTNLIPVLQNLAGQGDNVSTTIVELKNLMVALAQDRKSIGRSIDAVGQLVGTTSEFLDTVDDPLVRALDEFVTTAKINASTRNELRTALKSFTGTVEALGRITSYENAGNLYPCALYLKIGGTEINPVGNNGPWSEVCKS